LDNRSGALLATCRLVLSGERRYDEVARLGVPPLADETLAESTQLKLQEARS
jgi:hypothetical protein